MVFRNGKGATGEDFKLGKGFWKSYRIHFKCLKKWLFWGGKLPVLRVPWFRDILVLFKVSIHIRNAWYLGFVLPFSAGEPGSPISRYEKILRGDLYSWLRIPEHLKHFTPLGKYHQPNSRNCTPIKRFLPRGMAVPARHSQTGWSWSVVDETAAQNQDLKNSELVPKCETDLQILHFDHTTKNMLNLDFPIHSEPKNAFKAWNPPIFSMSSLQLYNVKRWNKKLSEKLSYETPSVDVFILSELLFLPPAPCRLSVDTPQILAIGSGILLPRCSVKMTCSGPTPTTWVGVIFFWGIRLS